MPSKLKKAIAAVKDQTSIGLAKVSRDVSSNLEVAVLKATSHDDVPVEEKYVSEVVYLVSSNKVHAAACARAIGKRIGRTRNWVVALKSLMLVLRIFQDGDPYFPREVLHAMKRGAKILNLSSFKDDSNSSPWDFWSFVRTFALYLDERLECFLTGKLQRRYKQEGSTSSYQRSKSLRTNEPVQDMKQAMLLDKMSYWQRLLDRDIATRTTGAAQDEPFGANRQPRHLSVGSLAFGSSPMFALVTQAQAHQAHQVLCHLCDNFLQERIVKTESESRGQ